MNIPVMVEASTECANPADNQPRPLRESGVRFCHFCFLNTVELLA